ncbi:MAG: class I SAM-dependent methyltransferase [Alphaproteobacteria bacterium]
MKTMLPSPSPRLTHIKRLRARLQSIFFDPWQLRYSHERQCPVCDFDGHFLSFGNPPRRDALCPRCFSLERHRLLYIYLTKDDKNKLYGKTVLHFAPEPFIKRINKNCAGYITADLWSEDVDFREDITKMHFNNEEFDLIICNHVLEHVQDDEKAMRECWRILKKNGLALFMIPIIDAWERTYENARVVSDEDRELHFGQCDHVRFYGADFVDKLTSAGFIVSRYVALPQMCVLHGLLRGETVFTARKVP